MRTQFKDYIFAGAQEKTKLKISPKVLLFWFAEEVRGVREDQVDGSGGDGREDPESVAVVKGQPGRQSLPRADVRGRRLIDCEKGVTGEGESRGHLIKAINIW